MPFTVDPIRLYENVNGICTVTSTAGTLAVGNNQVLVAAVTGRRIRIMGWIMQSDAGGPGKVTFKSNSGGTAITGPIFPPLASTGITEKLPIADSGYVETLTGEGLYVDVVTTNVYFTVFYIIYTP